MIVAPRLFKDEDKIHYPIEMVGPLREEHESQMVRWSKDSSAQLEEMYLLHDIPNQIQSLGQKHGELTSISRPFTAQYKGVGLIHQQKSRV